MGEAKTTTGHLANPFRPGNGVAPPYLAGRDQLLETFEGFLVDRPLHANWTLTGLRGTGKTVLAAEFAARAERAGWITLSRELGERHRDDVRLAEAIVDDVDALRRRLSPLAAVGQAIEDGVRSLRPRRLTIGEFGYEPSFGEGSDEPAARMRDALHELDAAVASTERRGAILFYDEAHIVAEDPSHERYPLSSLLAALASVQRAEPRIRMILVGLPTLSLNLKRARTYAERMFRHVVVGNLHPADARDALTVPLEVSGRSFAPELLDHLVTTTGAYPYFLQFMAAYACRSVIPDEVDLAAYREVEPTLLHELDLAFFDDRFDSASPAEQQILLAMSRQTGYVHVAELRHDRADLAGHEVLLRRLIDRGLVYRPKRGTYDFALPLFRDYLHRREAHPTDPTGTVGSVGIGRQGDGKRL